MKKPTQKLFEEYESKFGWQRAIDLFYVLEAYWDESQKKFQPILDKWKSDLLKIDYKSMYDLPLLNVLKTKLSTCEKGSMEYKKIDFAIKQVKSHLGLGAKIVELDVDGAKQVSIISLFNRYGFEVKRNFVCCPFHGEKTASLKIYPEKNSWSCFGCKAGGDSITFIEKIEHLDFIKAVRFLNNMR